MSTFFARVSPTVLTPSQTAFLFLQERMKFTSAKVVPLGTVVMDKEPIRTIRPDSIRVGFLGLPLLHKGWNTFDTLASRHIGDTRYTFHHVGRLRDEDAHNCLFIEVSVTRSDPDAMINAIVELDLDVIINWSHCYETFSYATHEALAGGAFVVTRRGSGHIWPAVVQTAPDLGCALGTEEELFELFDTGRIITLLPNKRYGRFERRAMTASYLFQR
jgi:hypothetical protein